MEGKIYATFNSIKHRRDEQKTAHAYIRTNITMKNDADRKNDKKNITQIKAI